MTYLDFFVVPLPIGNEEKYRETCRSFCAVMKDYGMLTYCEATADNVPHGQVTDFYRSVAAKENETVVAAFMTWPDKETRDKGWELGMNDPRMSHDPNAMPFDGQRMFWGGFKPLFEHP